MVTLSGFYGPTLLPVPFLLMGGGRFPLGALHPRVGFHTFKFSSNTPFERAICFLLRPRLIPNYEKKHPLLLFLMFNIRAHT